MMVKLLLGSWRDDKGNTILHLAAKKAPPHMLNSVPAAGGSVFQMRKDLIWFKKVKSILLPQDRLIRNGIQDTAQAIFTKGHKGLVKEGEEFMRSTATTLLLSACIIAFTIYTSLICRAHNNIILLVGRLPFVEYLAFGSSLTSVVIFLSILTSFYGEGDFLTSLPLKLVIGQATLMFSLAMMTVSMAAVLYIRDGIRLLAFAAVPVLLLALSVIISFIQMFTDTKYGRTRLVSHDQDMLLRVCRRNYYRAQGSN